MTGSSPRPATPPKLPLLLLGLLTLGCFGGPFLIALVIRGGERAEWPPDRPLEWWVLGVVVAIVTALMGACVTVGIWAKHSPTS